LAIVAICHQTSPIGERPLEGIVEGSRSKGWDYLKTKFLLAARSDISLCNPQSWAAVNPLALSTLFADDQLGLTLNRVSERAYLLNDLGHRLVVNECSSIRTLFDACKGTLAGGDGFLHHLSQFAAYSDPLKKKSFFFLSLMQTECGWTFDDPESLQSPVDYHEIRGHLRLGSVDVHDARLASKLRAGIPVNQEEDAAIRCAVQEANASIARMCSAADSELHYLLWNVFRNCCPRASLQTHCSTCPPDCLLPAPYRAPTYYQSRCIFAPICASANKDAKPVEPAYLGHYY
jgi:hypothetical protein